MIPALVEAKIPVITGATGFEWPKNLERSLVEQKIPWIYASNFSLGLNMMLLLCDRLNSMAPALANSAFQIEETHHTKKLDAPSGSAISIKERFNSEIPIESIREGDVVGTHEIQLKAPNETIAIRHEAKDRNLFADGGIWAARSLVENTKTDGGLYNFTDILAKDLLQGENHER